MAHHGLLEGNLTPASHLNKNVTKTFLFLTICHIIFFGSVFALLRSIKKVKIYELRQFYN